MPDVRQLRKGPGYCLGADGDDLVLRLWWRFGHPNPATWRGATTALSDAIASGIGHRVVVDLREAPAFGSRAVRRGVERLLAVASLAGRPVLVACGPASIQRRDVEEIVGHCAPAACIRFPASSLPPESLDVAA